MTEPRYCPLQRLLARLQNMLQRRLVRDFAERPPRHEDGAQHRGTHIGQLLRGRIHKHQVQWFMLFPQLVSMLPTNILHLPT